MHRMHPTDPRAPIPGALTVPLWALTFDRQCACARNGCNAQGKHPRWHMPPMDGGGYGVLCGTPPNGSGVFVVDLDIKPDRGINGLQAFQELHHSATGEDFPDTLIVSTGSGGFHLYFRMPPFEVATSIGKLAKGVDIIGEGSWVVGPGSPHKSGRPYSVVRDSPLAEAPEWLLGWPGLVYDAATHNAPKVPVNTLTDMESPQAKANMEAFRAECAGELPGLEPAIQGQGGHNRLFHVAKRGTCYYLLPPEIVESIIWDYYNPRCMPPWKREDQTERDEVSRKVWEAIRTNKDWTPGPAPSDWGANLVKRMIVGPNGNPEGEIPLRVHSEDHEYQVQVGDCIANGKLLPRTLSEVIYRLRRSPEWMGVLRYDQFSDAIRAVDPPVPLEAESKRLSENDITGVRVWFEVCADTLASADMVRSAVYAAAFAAPMHPVREYLFGLPPQNPEVLKGLSAQWFGACEDLDRELLTRFLVGAARRILWPGQDISKLDNMLVLQGDQNVGKSSWTKALFGRAWTNEQMPDIHSKDASQVLATGVWAQQWPELDKMLKAEPSTVKDYLTRETDKYRPAYGRDFVEVPRQCCFVGDTNQDQFLRDVTGERRFWPIKVFVPTINLGLVRSMRDTVWGAVMVLAQDTTYRHHVDNTLDSELRVSLERRHSMFAVRDGWADADAVYDYCLGRKHVVSFELFKTVMMNGAPDALLKWGKREQDRIGEALRRMGAKPTSVRHPVTKAPKHVWEMPPHISGGQPSEKEQQRRKAVESVVNPGSPLPPPPQAPQVH